MNILHVITGMQKAAGTSVFCGEVCNQLVAQGHEVTLATISGQSEYSLDPRIRVIAISDLVGVKSWSGRKEDNNSNLQLVTPTPTNQKVQTPSSTSTYDLIHIHALWQPILHRVSSWARTNHIPVIWSPHGMITPWAMNNKKWKKYLAWYLYQKRDLQSAALLHATAQSEVEDIQRMGLKNKVMIAPLGVNLPDLRSRTRSRSTMEDSSLQPSTFNVQRSTKTLLFVSRVQRKKGLPMLLDAWAKLPSEIKKNWYIRIVGPDQDNHIAELKSQCDRLGLTYLDETEIIKDESGRAVVPSTAVNKIEPPSSTSTSSSTFSYDVVFVGPKFDNDLQQEYANADLFVLPTHSENFGSVVIEALAHNVPVICTKGAPWKDLEDYNCGYWVDISVDALADALGKTISMSPEERREMGLNGHALVYTKYTWKAVGDTIAKVYQKIIGQVDRVENLEERKN